MPKIGIVGHEAAKFTVITEMRAKGIIRELLANPCTMVSGHCHLGGVDIWAEEIADELKIPKIIHPPAKRSWYGGYRDRNLKIARDSDVVVCIAVLEYPPDYHGMRFEGCYHCGDRIPPHVKSGGCWTAWKAKKRVWHIIRPDGDSRATIGR